MRELFEGVIGQDAAVDRLLAAVQTPVPAYLFVGPNGSGKRHAARAFAAALLTPVGGPPGRDARLALAGEHPDVVEIVRAGASISVETAREVQRLAALAPVEGQRKVIILDEMHLMAPAAAATLLKTIEEPTASTVFVVVADEVPPELVTIASRCVRIDFGPVPEELISATLVREGADPASAELAASAAAGDLDRARLLAGDPDLVDRRDAWRQVPQRLDGTGAMAARLVDELLGAIDRAAGPLKRRQAEEAEAHAARAEQYGQRSAAGRKELEERHKRELRRLRTDELRFGLGTLAATYRDRFAVHGRPADGAAVDAIHTLLRELVRNPNDALQLQALFLVLPAQS